MVGMLQRNERGAESAAREAGCEQGRWAQSKASGLKQERRAQSEQGRRAQSEAGGLRASKAGEAGGLRGRRASAADKTFW